MRLELAETCCGSRLVTIVVRWTQMKFPCVMSIISSAVSYHCITALNFDCLSFFCGGRQDICFKFPFKVFYFYGDDSLAFEIFCRYIFPCKDWITIQDRINKRYGKPLEVKKVEESQTAIVRSELSPLTLTSPFNICVKRNMLCNMKKALCPSGKCDKKVTAILLQ